MKKRFMLLSLIVFLSYKICPQGFIINNLTSLKDTVIITSLDSITFTSSMIVNRRGGVKDSVQLSIIDSVSFNTNVINDTTKYKLNIKTFKRNGVSGVDADYCGLTAIGDALASIIDATKYNRYELRGIGNFTFTSPRDLVYTDPDFGEYAIIEGKDWVDIKGYSRDSLVIAIEFPDTLAIDYGQYQPVMWNCNSKLSNATIIAKNCRYGLHFEGGNHVIDKTSSLDSLLIWHMGNYNYAAVSQFGSTAWVSTNAIGAGMRDGQTFDIRNCVLRSDQNTPMQNHSAMANVNKGGWIYLINCTFIGPIYPFRFNIYPVNRYTEVFIENPVCKSKPIFCQTMFYSPVVTSADYSETEIKADVFPLAFDNSGTVGGGLRIKSKSTGLNSTITLDPSSSAFPLIFGNMDSVIQKTRWGNNYQFGYEYRMGGIGMSGYAMGHVDVDENNSVRTNSLGLLLGDCSINNKTLTIIIDGTKYDIIFNLDYTTQSNGRVIERINEFVGAVADVDIYAVGKEYYPTFKGNLVVMNSDSSAIKSGMGVLLIGDNHVRIANNSDGHIDGIAIDDFANCQNGRIITGGYIYSALSSMRFSTLEVSPQIINAGDELGICPSMPGYFDTSASPKLLRAVDCNLLQILESSR